MVEDIDNLNRPIHVIMLNQQFENYPQNIKAKMASPLNSTKHSKHININIHKFFHKKIENERLRTNPF